MFRAWFVRIRNSLGKWLFRSAQRVSVVPLGGPTFSANVSVVTPHLRPDELAVSASDPYAQDLLGRDSFGTGLARLVDYGGGTGVVLVDADWGNGKTTFLRMWVQEARNDGKVVASLNAWDGDYRDNPLQYIAEQLAAELKRHVPRNLITRLSNWTRQAWNFVHRALRRVVTVGTAATSPTDGGVVWVAGVALELLIRSLRNVKDAGLDDAKRLESVRAKLRRAAAALRNPRKGQPVTRFVVVVDELDRCRPDYAVRFMEVVKHVFEVEHVTFVLAANSAELAHAMSGVYGDKFDGQRYLERFFDIWLPLPEGPRDHFVTRVVRDARFASRFGKELPRDVLDDSFSAEDVVGYLLQHSAMSLREIHKTLNHIKVMLLVHRNHLAPCVLTALVLATLRSVSREAYDALDGGYQGNGAAELLCTKLGKTNLSGDPILEFVDDILYWCWQEAEQELRSGQRRRSERPEVLGSADDLAQAPLTERRSARKHLVRYRLVRDVIEMTASSSKSS